MYCKPLHDSGAISFNMRSQFDEDLLSLWQVFPADEGTEALVAEHEVPCIIFERVEDEVVEARDSTSSLVSFFVGEVDDGAAASNDAFCDFEGCFLAIGQPCLSLGIPPLL